MTQMKMDLEKGIHRLLGELLIEMGSMTDLQVAEVLQEQERTRDTVSIHLKPDCWGR
ncbi:MAG: hypothetical protein AB1512_10470 [Thermodesulfobacteriota bacterium]